MSKRKRESQKGTSSKKKRKLPSSSDEESIETTDFENPSLASGEIKIVTWNVASFNAVQKKGFADYVRQEDPFLIFLNETKTASSKVKEDHIEGYHAIFTSCSHKPGYSGVGLFSKVAPISTETNFGVEELDCEGRMITAEYDDFYIVGTYVPNAGQKLKRMDYRMQWDEVMLNHLNTLKEIKPVIWCGDLNVAHLEIDLKNPKSNRNKTAGFTDKERNNFTTVLNNGFVDTYRYIY
eukprot:TRINITY_DN3161_c0_g1_i3.p1 TRINITY_DN3161_c0_g1~~TRINITY_DN3161_c0_g1_i3.p1  ORF type:complete len:237 (-),score=68.05 TRINITY_DN3161_c0_g1_i3:278-988(-)